MDYAALVKQFADKNARLLAMQTLTGTSLSATALREVHLPWEAKQALLDGLQDSNPAVRYNCIALLDHLPDDDVLSALGPMLDDPVPRVRRIAVHALGCLACKPDANATLPPALVERIACLSQGDPNLKVRAEASNTLACRGVPAKG
jgi:HEAT repeat protein